MTTTSRIILIISLSVCVLTFVERISISIYICNFATAGLATRFMDVNKKEAHKNFGNSADNMSLVVCTIYPSFV